MVKPQTSWGKVTEWYDALLEGEQSYQKDVILPNLVRLLAPKKSETILDAGCGQGFFAREFAKHGARVSGVDVAPELIAFAKKSRSQSDRGSSTESGNVLNAMFHVASADAMPFVKTASIDAVTIILALQNIENVDGVFSECARVLAPHGRLLVVMSHPVFRIPKHSSWGWDPSTPPGARETVQYRRIDEYLSQSRAIIAMHPGGDSKATTVSFHRPLQWYMKLLAKHGFAVTRLEEWISNKKSQKGPRQATEDRARKEIPLFLFFEARQCPTQ